MSKDRIKALAVAVRKADGKTAILTGAGISTESGVPDYRSSTGLWQNKTLEEMARLSVFRRDPASLWAFYRERLKMMRSVEPNDGHRVIAALEKAGLAFPVITQNIDGLHRRAGSTAVEVHGTIFEANCLECDERLPIDEAEKRAAADPEGIPYSRCGAPMKPAVVLFEEMLPPAIDDAYSIVSDCELLICCGTSLLVQPVANFAWMAKERGKKLVIINRGETGYDEIADLKIDGGLGVTLSALAAELQLSL